MQSKLITRPEAAQKQIRFLESKIEQLESQRAKAYRDPKFSDEDRRIRSLRSKGRKYWKDCSQCRKPVERHMITIHDYWDQIADRHLKFCCWWCAFGYIRDRLEFPYAEDRATGEAQIQG